MLWDESGRYLLAVERETQLFFFVLQYIAQVDLGVNNFGKGYTHPPPQSHCSSNMVLFLKGL